MGLEKETNREVQGESICHVCGLTKNWIIVYNPWKSGKSESICICENPECPEDKILPEKNS